MFGDTLRRIRVRDGLKQSEFSKKLGVPPHSYSAIERGKVRSGSKFLPRILKSFDNPEDTHAVEEAYKQMKEEDDSRIFTLYQGTEKVGTGTLSEVANMINVKVTTLYTYNSNGYRYKNKSNPNIRTLVPEGEVFIPPTSTKNIFGDTLKQIRKESNLSLASMARKLHEKKEHYEGVEKGTLGIKTRIAQRICKNEQGWFTDREHKQLRESYAKKEQADIEHFEMLRERKKTRKHARKHDSFRISNIPDFYERLRELEDSSPKKTLQHIDKNDPRLQALRILAGGPKEMTSQ